MANVYLNERSISKYFDNDVTTLGLCISLILSLRDIFFKDEIIF